MITAHTKKYYPYALMHCSYPMNSGALVQKKRAKTQNFQTWT